MPQFVHLHLHSEYSLLDGACRISELVAKAKSMNMGAVAVTDHGVMYGAVEFYKEAHRQGIKPIIGCEVYTALPGRFDTSHSEFGHLVLLCRNNEGYENLCKLVSLGFLEGFYRKPRVDFELLKKYSGGLIALSACLSGDVPTAILNGNYEGAERLCRKFVGIFGKDGFFLEMQNHGLPQQSVVNEGLVRLSRELQIPLVITNDAHYINKQDAKKQKVLMCIQMAKTVDEDDGYFKTDEFYMKSESEMRSAFATGGEIIDKAIENTAKIADMCNVAFTFGNYRLPKYIPEKGELQGDNVALLRALAEKGLIERYGEAVDTVKDRLDYELDTIKKMGFTDYFLIVRDFVHYAKSKNIPVGPGRGSAAGSLVSYCLNITDVDPIKYGLLFERFLNPERISMPDIDIDFCYERRGEVIAYVVSKYGSDNVAQIITFGTMLARNALRDVGRALGVPYAQVDAAAKLIPFIGARTMTIEGALQRIKPFREIYDSSDKMRELIDTAMGLEGLPRHASTHAAGVVITEKATYEYMPMQKSGDAVITQYPMGTLEELGFLKMDFLALRNLTVIDDAARLIKKNDPSFSMDFISYEDDDVFKMLSEGKSEGVFQMESAGMRQVLCQLKPSCLEDIIATIALYRPGPMNSIPKFIENRLHKEKITYSTPLLKDILDVTYGCMVYQEQVMEIVRRVAGYSYGRADLVRRSMSKKKLDVMENERHTFIYGEKDQTGKTVIPGAVANGIDEKTANSIFDDMVKFAEYAFNKSHAASYAVLSYRTAYLKKHHEKEYMAALLTSVLGRPEKVAEYIAECENSGISVVKPAINQSMDKFSVSEGKILFGLAAIKNVGRAFIASMVAERNSGGKFSSFYDFSRRMSAYDLNKKALESMILTGAFDEFGITRRSLMLSYERIMEDLSQNRRKSIEGQVRFFDSPGAADREITYVQVEEFSLSSLLRGEKEMTGLYFSGSPLAEYTEAIKASGAVPLRTLIRYSDPDGDSGGDSGINIADGERITAAGIIDKITLIKTKNGDSMAFLALSDDTAGAEIIVFPKVFSAKNSVVQEGRPVMIRGRVSIKEDENGKIIAEKILPLKTSLVPVKTHTASELSSKMQTLYLKVPSKGSLADKVLKLLSTNKGESPAIMYFGDTGKAVKCGYGIRITPILIAKLKDALGNDSVIIK